MKKIFIIIFVLVSEVGFGQGLFSQYKDIKDNFQQCNPPEVISQKKIKAMKIIETFLIDSLRNEKGIAYYNRKGEIAKSIYCLDSLSNDSVTYNRCDKTELWYSFKEFKNGRHVKTLGIKQNTETGKRDTTHISSYTYTDNKVIKRDSSKSFIKIEELTYDSKKRLIARKTYDSGSTSADIEYMKYDRKGYLTEIKNFQDSTYRNKVVYKYRKGHKEKTALSYSFRGSLHAIQRHLYDKNGRLIEESRESPKNSTTYQKLLYIYSPDGLLDHVDDFRTKKQAPIKRYIFEYEYYE